MIVIRLNPVGPSARSLYEFLRSCLKAEVRLHQTSSHWWYNVTVILHAHSSLPSSELPDKDFTKLFYSQVNTIADSVHSASDNYTVVYHLEIVNTDYLCSIWLICISNTHSVAELCYTTYLPWAFRCIRCTEGTHEVFKYESCLSLCTPK